MPKSTAQLSQKIRQFYRWWWPNFCFWLPATVQAYYAKLKPIYLDIYYGENDEMKCHYQLNDNQHHFSITAGLTNALAVAIEQTPQLQNATIRLFFPKNLVIYRELTLPKLAQEELDTLIEYQIETLTPFKSQEIYFNTLIIKEDNEHIDVSLFILQKDIANSIMDRLDLMGIRPKFFMSEQFQKNFPNYKNNYNFLPQNSKVNISYKKNVFYTAIASLIIAIIAFPFFADTYSLEVIDNNIAVLQKSNKQISSHESRISQYLEKYNQLNALYTHYHYPRSVLNQITQTIDPRSWIIHMQLTHSKVELQGFTENSATLLQLFETSVFFKHVRFLSPTSKDKVTNMEKFHLSMEFED